MRKVWMFALLMLGGAMLAPAVPTFADGTGHSKEGHNYTLYHGKVTAVNAADATITIADKGGASQTFTIPAGTKVSVNGAESSLAAITVDMYGGVKMQNGTIIMVKAWTPKDKHKA